MEKIMVYHAVLRLWTLRKYELQDLTKTFYFGFYCTIMRKQAERWATRYGQTGYVNLYEYHPNENLKMLKFEKMTEEWLDFIAACRIGKAHDYDIVEGPMADDTIFNYVQGFIDGKYSRTAFWELAKFKHPTHQISFHTARAFKPL